jgi:hypothetical protein
MPGRDFQPATSSRMSAELRAEWFGSFPGHPTVGESFRTSLLCDGQANCLFVYWNDE